MARPSAATLHRLSRPPLERMKRIHDHIQQRRFPNCTDLAGFLEVSTKTIMRDVEFMRDRLDLPIAYDQIKHGFHYTAPVQSFPTVQVTEGELIALCVAEKALAQYRGTSFEKPLRAAFQKLTDGLQDRVTFSWSDLDERISFRSLGATVADLKLFETVSSTVLHSRGLEFEYHKLGGSGHEKRRVQPYNVSCIDGQWYLFAFDLDRQQMRTFVLGRMRQARSTGKKFRRGPFSLALHLGQSLGVFSTGKDGVKEIRIWFDAFAARLVRERQWHPSQKIKDLEQGALELALKLGSFPEVIRWVLSWGEHARALAPAALRQELATATRKMAALYE